MREIIIDCLFVCIISLIKTYDNNKKEEGKELL